MTTLFAYDSLKWPVIKALSRSTPLIIPFNLNFDYIAVAEALGNPPSLGILPSIPFGWIGSGLVIRDEYVANYAQNLINSLRDDGFINVYLLTNPGFDYNLGSAHLIAEIHESDRDSNPIPPSSDKDKVVIIPIGHTEQHGFHLPMSTDTLIIDAIAKGVIDLDPDLATRISVFPYGVSTHRQAFAGTLSAGGRAFENFWISVIDSLVARGFKRFYFISGHGGNYSFLVNIVKYVGERHRRIFCATSWLYLSGTEGVKSISTHRKSQIGGMGHAGELETSLILHLQPGLVEMDKVVDETDFITTPSYYMDWVEGGSLVANPPWDDDTKTGSYGSGSLGTAAKGAKWLEDAIKEKLDHVREIHEQHTRREERRNSGYGLWGE